MKTSINTAKSLETRINSNKSRSELAKFMALGIATNWVGRPISVIHIRNKFYAGVDVQGSEFSCALGSTVQSAAQELTKLGL